MTIKYGPLEKREEILKLFREALNAENARDLETAKRKLDDILGLSKDFEPEFYFEACFRMAEVFIQEDNYRGAVKCALRGILRAPSADHYRFGIKRLGDLLFILKENGKLGVLAENMEPTLNLVKDDEELYRFTMALVRLARGEDVKEEFKVKEFNDILRSLRE